MPQPIDYSGIIERNTPAERNLLGYSQLGAQQGQQMYQAYQQAKQQKAARDQAEAQKQAFMAIQTPNDAQEFLDKNPQMGAAIKAKFAFKEEQDSKKVNLVANSARAALESGNKEAALKILTDASKAYERTDLDKQEALEGIARQIEFSDSPESAKRIIDLYSTAALGQEYIDVAQKNASVKKTMAEASKIEQETGKLQQEMQQDAIKAQELPEDVRKIYRGLDATLATSNDELAKMGAIVENIIGVKPEDFGGGALDRMLRSAQETLSGKEWGEGGEKRSLLRSQLAGLRLSEAMKMKASGALSEGEMNELLKTTPPDGADIGVYKKWIGARIAVVQSARAKDEIRRKFIIKNGTDLPSDRNGVINVNGKKIAFKKGETAEDIVSKLGKKVRNYAPSYSGSPDTELEGGGEAVGDTKTFVDGLFE
jgi:hypothetical protein